MGREDEELTCADPPRWMSLRDAREVVRRHRRCGCAVEAVAATLLAGGHRACWPETESLRTAAEWVDAYAARNLTTSVDDHRVGLLADETVTAVSMPHEIAARVYDRLGSPAATLAPAPQDLCTTDWIVLVRPEPIPAQALTVLGRVGVRVLPPPEIDSTCR